MFYGQCNDCNERWELGTASTCKCPDEALASEAKKPDFWEGYVPEPVKPRGEATLAQQWSAGVPPLYPEPEPGVSIKAEYEPAQPYKSLADYPRYWIDPVTGDVSIGTPSTPAQRTWQGLTDEEIEQGCKESWVTEQAWQSAVWWAEAKLRSKNT